VHIRESGFKHLGGHEEAPFDVARNSRFDNYDRAFDLLLSRGYAVVRIGDPMMTPLRRQGVIDLATSPHRNDLLELWCLAKSSFHLGCDSGPGAVCLLLNTPTVLVNTTNPINTYPVRAGSIYIMKHAVDRQSGRELSLTDMLTEEYLANWRTTRRYKYIDNSAEEIYLAVQEMLEIVDGAGAETPEQAEYRRRVYEAVESLKPKVGYIRKWGTDDEFLGDGRICRFFAERHLHPQEPPAPARESGGELAGSVVR
jgi:putative glycosyltransferase (TIGR04372 family)